MHGALRQRCPHVENRKLLDLAHRVEHCVNCGCHVPEGCQPAHSNEQRHGRGASYKSHDHHHAALCHECHNWYDRGTKGPDPTNVWQPTKADKSAFFQTMRDRTMDLYWARGWITVR